ncbi:MAG: aminotransferase class V-fold PLP-dependent enzyme [Sediminibacterium sp.]|nr:aminotransferase class V-fold PLP-dependent enzyme [Sediminibacterium sp.]
MLGAGSIFQQLHAANFSLAEKNLTSKNPIDIALDADYWRTIQDAYTASKSDIVILNNGGVSPQPIAVQQALDKYNAFSSRGPSYYMWRQLDKGREPLRERLAKLAKVSAEEIAINRNATEALNTVIYGLDFEKGDEVIGTYQDYPNMIQAWRQRAMRDGLVYKQINFQFPIEDDDAIVAAFEREISSKTKLLHITHVVNWVGQILPVRKICDMAHKKGIEVLVDGAHSFGLLDFSIADLNCDYFGTSLHKFLSAPIGSGMLWIKKEHISKVWPLICNDQPKSSNIRKFETLGTRSFAIEQAIGEAIQFHESIGAARKEARIRYLKNRWCNQVIKQPKVRLHTSMKNEYACAIAGFSIDGMRPAEIDSILMSQYKIHTVGIEWENIKCVRVTPHVYTTEDQVDLLAKAILEIAGRKA